MENFGIYLEPVRLMLYQVGALLPRLLMAVIVLLAGWMLAKVARFATNKMLRAINFNVLNERSGMDNFLRQGGLAGDTTSLFGWLVYWLVILAAMLVAFNGLGLSYISDLLGRVVWFVPNVFVALLVLTFGVYFARFIGDTVMTYCRNVKLPDAAFLGQLAKAAIMVFVVLIALDQIKVGGDIVRQSFLIILAGVVLAFALAFGIGGKDWAAERIQQWWPRARSGSPTDSAADSALDGANDTAKTLPKDIGKDLSGAPRPPLPGAP